jgi:hypothetical protein
MKATAGPSSPSARVAVIPNAAVVCSLAGDPALSHRIRRPRGRIRGLRLPAVQPWPWTSPDVARRRTRRPSHRDPDALSIDLAGEKFHIATSLGLRLKLKTPAPTPPSSDPAFPRLERRCSSSIPHRMALMNMVGVGPYRTRDADSRSTPVRCFSSSTEEAAPFDPRWWPSLGARRHGGAPQRACGDGAAPACHRPPWLPEMVLS